ncbi:MAG TPA: chemotaxis protein CheB [Opitutaceae bacterium]|nr:chemotaxis protein CheB [Opitutaceae bacterium]
MKKASTTKGQTAERNGAVQAVKVLAPNSSRPATRSGRHAVKTSRAVKSSAGALDAESTREKNSFPIAGIGASAGGLEAFTKLLRRLPVDTGMAFVLVQHLDPLHESALTEILSRATLMRVQEVTNNLRVEPNHVYAIPPNTCMEIRQGILKLTPRGEQARGAQRSIDSFFESLARDRANRAIGVVLSGTASDGTLGLEAIKAEGGITFAQDESAKFDAMPRNAMAAGCVDFVLPPAAIADELARIAKHPLVVGAGGSPIRRQKETDRVRVLNPLEKRGGAGDRGEAGERSDPDAQGFANVLLLLRNHSGVDFSLYKSSTIRRRISRRMVLNRQHALEGYAGFLRGNAKELDALYSDVLISVTSFFRNAEAFETLKRKVFPALLAQRGREGPVRVWTLGCSTGQEAYSIAMCFAEFADKIAAGAPKLQIFATDLNEAMLEKARHGLYAKTLARDISPERLKRFFVEEEGGYRISKTLREQVVFARQNIMSDPPFSRMDLISCRNLLIYLEAGLQKKIMPAFHYALKPGGFLFLGASESVGPFVELFGPADKKQKIFSKKVAPTPSFRMAVPPGRSAPASPAQRRPAERAAGALRGMPAEFDAQREADRLSVNQFAPPGVLINADLQVLQFRGATGAYLQPPVGKASFDLLKMARDWLMLPLRAAINKARREQMPVRRENVPFRKNGETHTMHLQVIPLKNVKERCYLILFEEGRDRTGSPEPTSPATWKGRKEKSVPAERKAWSRRVAELERELAETREYLQSIQERYEASTEELQVSSEEGQSANEELQSINEELETSKEELESTNEELTTVNEEMNIRNAELNGLNNDLSNLHVSINTAILVLGRDLTIRRFTAPAQAIFNLLAGDVGRPMSGIRHNLDCRDLEEFVREVIDTSAVREREVRSKDGHWYSLRARPYVTRENKIDGAVLVLVDIDALKLAEVKVQLGQDYADAILQEMPPLLILDKDQHVMKANKSFYAYFKVTPAQTEHRSIYDLGDGQWQIPKLRTLLEDILPRHSFFTDFEIVHNFPGLGRRTILLHGRQLDSVQQIVLRMEDVTERLESRASMLRSEIRYRRVFEASKDGILILDPGTRKITDANPYISQLLGYARNELVGRELWEIGLLKDEQASLAAFRALQKDGFIRYEDLPLETKQGKKREVEFVSNLYDEAGTKVIQCNIRDITERKLSDDALRASEKRLVAVLEQLPVGVSLIDPLGRMILSNSIMRKFMSDGLPSADVSRADRWRAWGADGLPLETSRWPGVRALRGETVVPGIEFLFQQDDGTALWTSVSTSPLREEDGAVVGAVVMVQDINQRKLTELALRQSEGRVARILESITDSFYVVDAEWVFTDMNAAARRVFKSQGIDPASLLGKNFWTEAFPDTRGTRLEVEYRRAMRDRVAGEFDYFYAAWQRWFSLRVFPIEEGGITIYFQDITERKLADTALLQSVEDLKIAQLAAERGSRAKDDFLAALSHELRTPLAPVLLAATALREDPRVPVDLHEQIGMMERNIALEARLIDDLLDLTAISRGKLQLHAQLCDTHSLIGLAVEIVREDAREKGVSIARDFTAHYSGLVADPARFQQVIWNLLRNAVKFTPSGGTINIHTRGEKNAAGERWLRIEVTDSGIGIEPALLERIFLPFDQGSLTADHRFGGLGLGLAIARAVVDLHGGRISATSDGANQGSTFVVELPGAVEPASGIAESLPPFSTLAGGPVSRLRPETVPVVPLRLLLVEDHVTTLITLARLLRRDGHEVTTAKTMAEGLAAAAARTFDLVISDLGLPDGTGTELMEKLRAAYGLRGIALSGYGMEEDIARSRDAGFITHLVKPVSIAELRRVLAALPPA